ncbi:MAG: tRNA (N6-isopentenyl adenosine(37)-C2)-methylthiotransferase MiaB [Acidobacteriota bacterium]
MSARGTYWVTTWGCQMNELDAERAAGQLRARGYERARALEVADVALFMTCSVREKAEAKVLSALSALKGARRANPDLVVGVLGCVAEQEGQAILDRSPVADIVVGPRQIERLGELVDDVRRSRARAVATGFAELDYEPSRIERTPGVRARVTIMEGCDFRCTFCVVPNTRGPEACRDPERILEEIRDLGERGFREVLLLGQTVNAYRRGGVSFPELLARIDAMGVVPRVKFVSSHPLHFTRELALAMKGARTLLPWVNLPVQSGSDRVLKRMKRLYTAEQFLERVAWLREALPNAGLSTDVIVGFPGETERDFVATLDLVDRAGFDSMYTFNYSPRPRTPALKLPDDVPQEEKSRRLQVVNDRQREIQRRKNAALIGSIQQVLIDEVDDGVVRGRTTCQRVVSLAGGPDPAELLGAIVPLRIVAAGVHGLAGERLPT